MDFLCRDRRVFFMTKKGVGFGDLMTHRPFSGTMKDYLVEPRMFSESEGFNPETQIGFRNVFSWDLIGGKKVRGENIVIDKDNFLFMVDTLPPSRFISNVEKRQEAKEEVFRDKYRAQSRFKSGISIYYDFSVPVGTEIGLLLGGCGSVLPISDIALNYNDLPNYNIMILEKFESELNEKLEGEVSRGALVLPSSLENKLLSGPERIIFDKLTSSWIKY